MELVSDYDLLGNEYFFDRHASQILQPIMMLMITTVLPLPIIMFFLLTGTQDPSTQSSTSTGLCIYKDKITILHTKKFISQDWKTPHEWGDVHSFVQATFSSFTFSFISSYYVSLFPFLLGNTSKTYPSPPYSLSRKSFAKKNLSGNGGLTPLPLTENCQKCYYKNGSKRAKIGVFGGIFSGFSLSENGGYLPL